MHIHKYKTGEPMKKFWLGLVIFLFSTGGAFAHGGNDLILHGYILDNACATKHKDDLAAFANIHDRACLLTPQSAKAGYSLYAKEDGQLHKFDDASNQKVAEFLKNPDNRVDVVVIAEKNGDALMIELIKNQRIVR